MNFKVSSGLKDLIGNELITDNTIAVFELVKNSFDAGAKKVILRFENIYSDDARIIIIDDGKGMDINDLRDKWLFVAYSAKRDGTEDDKEDADYRDNIKLRKFYAGAKGVGRFSCDRLGEKLNLITLKMGQSSKIQNLTINWADFEVDQTKEFNYIDVKHRVLTKIDYEIKHGTILEISNLRNRIEWNRDAFVRLKEKLSKLIRPQIGKTQRDHTFKIILDVPDEKQLDQDYVRECKKEDKPPEYRRLINGEIKNFIFESLDLRTTKIISEIDEAGETVSTTLVDREVEVYSLKEKNPYRGLFNVSSQLYFLNRSAKKTFTTRMGIEPVNYGNVFVYKNGFRIHPYGDPRNDMLGIDTRALQSYNRYLGTRNLIGQIDIVSNSSLKETTSRDGGLIRNQSYNQLIEFFFDKVLKRLEKYVVEVTDWGVDDEDLKELDDADVKARMVKHIANITKDDSVLDIQYNNDIVKLVEATQQGSATALVRNFKRMAAETNNTKLLKDVSSLEKKIEDFKTLNKANLKLEADNKRIQDELDVEKQKIVYLSIRRPLSEDAEKLIHSINFNLGEVDEMVIGLINKVKSTNKISKEFLIQELTNLKVFTEKSRKISEIATRANYRYDTEQQYIDIPTYLKEYLMVYNDIKKHADRSTKKVEVVVKGDTIKFKKYISPIEIAIIADNLIGNAIKWKDEDKKTLIHVSFKLLNDKLEIMFSDDGLGVSSKLAKFPDKIFELGVTDTKGSGIGLYSVRRCLEELGGKITFAGNGASALKGACFRILINK